jgi:hypothetical protein
MKALLFVLGNFGMTGVGVFSDIRMGKRIYLKICKILKMGLILKKNEI